MKRIAVAAALFAAACSAVPAAVEESALSGRATLAGQVPPWASSSRFKGAAASTDWVNFRVYLGWSDPAAAESLALAVSDPKSAYYGKFLTPQQFRAQFAPSQNSVGAVKSWLAAQGLNAVYVPQNNHYVAAEGTVAQVAAAFGTSFGTYAVNGLTLRAPQGDISIPSSLSGVVSAVVGLDQTGYLVHTNMAKEPDAPPAPAFVNGTPCSLYWGEKLATQFPNPLGSGALPYAPCGYTPQQVRSAYGISGWDGAGQTVAIIDAYASPTIQQDLDTRAARLGLPTTKITQVVAPGTYRHPETSKDPQGWYGEETLDVQAVHGMAPAATIVFVGSANAGQDLDAAMNHIVDRGLAQIVSNSYGWSTEFLPPGFIKPFEDTLIQAAIEGIGVYFSSGDDSDESLSVGYVTPDWPATSPWVTAVGGTSLKVSASGGYGGETGWGTARTFWNGSAWPMPTQWVYGAGGGVSRLFGVPSWQAGKVPAAVYAAQGRTGRAIPDVSAVADVTTGLLIGQTQAFPDGSVQYSEYRIGGTSLSCPIMAGIMALADQAHGSPHGFANPAFYGAGAAAYNDVSDPGTAWGAVRVDWVDFVSPASGARYSLRTFGQTLSLKTTSGWDDVTGLGTPNAAFIDALK